MRNTPAAGRDTWAAYVQAARERAGLTKSGLGERIGKDRATVARWEDGKHRPNDAELVARVAATLGLDLDETLAAAGMRPGATAPAEPTRERDEEIELIMSAPVNDATRRRMLERLAYLRERDKKQRLEDIRFLLERGA